MRQEGAVAVEAQPHAGDGVKAGTLGDVVDDARGRSEAIVQGRRAFQHFHAGLVLHGHLREVHDGHGAVEAVVGAVLHLHATNDQLVPGVAAVLLAGDAGGVAHGVVQAFGRLRFQHLAGNDVDGGGHVHHVGAAEGAGLDGNGLEALGAHGGDMHGLQRGAVLAGGGAFSAFGSDDDFLGMGQGGSKGQGQHQRQPAQGVGAGGDHGL